MLFRGDIGQEAGVDYIRVISIIRTIIVHTHVCACVYAIYIYIHYKKMVQALDPTP